MSCPIRTEGQEYVCSTCGIRWDFGDEQPECRTDTPRRRASDAQSWAPPPQRLELAARLRRILVAQTRGGRDPLSLEITLTFARDLVAELERTP